MCGRRRLMHVLRVVLGRRGRGMVLGVRMLVGVRVLKQIVDRLGVRSRGGRPVKDVVLQRDDVTQHSRQLRALLYWDGSAMLRHGRSQ